MGKLFRFLRLAVGVAFLVGFFVWRWFESIMDFLGHVMQLVGLVASPDELRNAVEAWLRAHPHLFETYGPYLLAAAGAALLLEPYFAPLFARYINGFLVRREINEAHGWSVSITMPRSIGGVMSSAEDSAITFQPIRFCNVSTSRPRQLDVTIMSRWHEDGRKRLLFRSDQDGKSAYQKKIGAMVQGDRILNCITFPLRLEPSEIVEGQIVIGVPDEIRRAWSTDRLITGKLHNGLKFTFSEHFSGRNIELEMGDYFDASKGYARSRLRRPKKSALLRLWVKKWRDKLFC